MNGEADTPFTDLLNNGPQRLAPKRITPEQRRDGLCKFDVGTSFASAGTFGQTSQVYYIEDKHEPESVIRAWLEENPRVRGRAEGNDLSLHHKIAKRGEAWREASHKIFGPFDVGGASGEGVSNTEKCPFCGDGVGSSIPNHMRNGCPGVGEK